MSCTQVCPKFGSHAGSESCHHLGGSGERETQAMTQQTQAGRATTPRASGTWALAVEHMCVCYSSHKPELCAVWKQLAPQLFENPLVLRDK